MEETEWSEGVINGAKGNDARDLTSWFVIMTS